MPTEAQRERTAKWRAQNREKDLQRKRDDYAANRARSRAATDAWTAANKERVAEYRRQYNQETRAVRAVVCKAWRDANRPARQELEAQRRARMLHPVVWADKGLIRDIYQLREIYEECGIECEVDHIVPLQGKTVSGLHVQTNLTVLLADDNASKGNRWWPDMPGRA